MNLILSFGYKDNGVWKSKLMNTKDLKVYSSIQLVLQSKLRELICFDKHCFFFVYRKKWYNLSDHIVSTENFQLTLTDLCFVSCIDLFIDLVCPILIKTQITRLVIMDYKISIDMLSKIINRLPYLTSLIIWSWSSLKTFIGIEKQHTIQAKDNDNKIRKVCLEKLMKLKTINFLIDLCPLMDYLEIINITYVDLQSLLQLIVRKHGMNIRHPFILCLKNYQIENEIIKKLQRTINEEKQNDNYTITCAYENIYLECKY